MDLFSYIQCLVLPCLLKSYCSSSLVNSAVVAVNACNCRGVPQSGGGPGSPFAARRMNVND